MTTRSILVQRCSETLFCELCLPIISRWGTECTPVWNHSAVTLHPTMNYYLLEDENYLIKHSAIFIRDDNMSMLCSNLPGISRIQGSYSSLFPILKWCPCDRPQTQPGKPLANRRYESHSKGGYFSGMSFMDLQTRKHSENRVVDTPALSSSLTSVGHWKDGCPKRFLSWNVNSFSRNGPTPKKSR